MLWVIVTGGYSANMDWLAVWENEIAGVLRGAVAWGCGSSGVLGGAEGLNCCWVV